MMFDTIIIGGGLAGLAAGIRSQQAGRHCLIVSTGQSALHFNSGTFDLLRRLPDGTQVTSPAESLPQLREMAPSHPYSKLTDKEFTDYAEASRELLTNAGISVKGTARKNHYRLSPMAVTKTAWLSMQEFLTTDEAGKYNFSKALLVDFTGYMDFYTEFFINKFEKSGVEITKAELDLGPLFDKAEMPLEQRSVNIERLFEIEEMFLKLAQFIKDHAGDAEEVLIPSVFGNNSIEAAHRLEELSGKKVEFLATFPPTVCGIRAQQKLKKQFEELGGYYIIGDTVTKAEIKDGKIKAVYTEKQLDLPLEGEEYILATGSFFSDGIIAVDDQVIEPIFGLDVDYCARDQWFDYDFFAKQNAESFGIKTDDQFRAIKDGKPLENLHVCGASLAGFDGIKQGCGGGVSLLSALKVADLIK